MPPSFPNPTLTYYAQNAKPLIERYEAARMEALHALLASIIDQGSRVLDIGFGSGRELEFLHVRGCEIYGIDPTPAFVDHAKGRFRDAAEHFYCDALPLSNPPLCWEGCFEAVICIAVWMHLEHDAYAEAVFDISKLCSDHAKVVISYSCGDRETVDARRFETVDEQRLIALFTSQGFSLINLLQNTDGLERSTLLWHTLVFSRD